MYHLQGVNLQVVLPLPELARMKRRAVIRTCLVDPISAKFVRVITERGLYGK